MLPKFPKFKKLELSDREAIEKITSKFPPYSDFNFVSMWCWDVEEKMRISCLNGNLVVRFTDYLTGEPFYSFIGDQKVSETAEILLKLSKKEGLKPELKLVPEDLIKKLNQDKFEIGEDKDNFDYVYDVENLVNMKGGKFETKRKRSRFFKKNFKHEIKVVNLNRQSVKNEIADLFNNWVADKGAMPADFFKNEFTALSRLTEVFDPEDIFALGIYLNDSLISISITENTHVMYNLSHFQKSRTAHFKGINDYFMREFARILSEKKIKYMNHEQDLGILGLRESKKSYLPCNYLKKYFLSFTTTGALFDDEL